ncbi:hypothetical protein [Sphingobacterium sp.]|uniref:hypothetical protein n=1 Tax=Sphingobacterium sp. TaxID=341027 RepID=UPI00289AD55F|nr:hypothetical protein [Sphingobacterium sp.]
MISLYDALDSLKKTLLATKNIIDDYDVVDGTFVIYKESLQYLTIEERFSVRKSLAEIYYLLIIRLADLSEIQRCERMLINLVRWGEYNDLRRLSSEKSFLHLLEQPLFHEFYDKCTFSLDFIKHMNLDDHVTSEPPYPLLNGDELKKLGRRLQVMLSEETTAEDDIAKLRNLLKFCQEHIVHDGGSRFEPKSSLTLLQQFDQNPIPLNCKSYSLFFRDCTQAMGMTCKIYQCFPRDVLGFNDDKHVINEVYLKEYNKFIMIDVSCGGIIFCDREHVLLSAKEVRNNLLASKRVYLQKLFSNNQFIDHDYYLYHYIAKNFNKLIER